MIDPRDIKHQFYPRYSSPMQCKDCGRDKTDYRYHFAYNTCPQCGDSEISKRLIEEDDECDRDPRSKGCTI